MIYVIDTSAFIFLDKEYHYDVFTLLWDKHFINLVDEGKLVSTIEVKNELKKQDDFLYNWIKKNCSQMFFETDDNIARHLKKLEKYNNFIDAEKPSSEDADPFVVALALEISTREDLELTKDNIMIVHYEKGSGDPHGPKLFDVVKYEGFKNGHLINIFKNERIKWEL